jgi:hypothetical protein
VCTFDEINLFQGLVDYEGGDSDEEDEENGDVNKRPRLS